MTNEDRLKSVLKILAEKFELQYCQIKYSKIDGTIENYFGVLAPITLLGEIKNGELHRNLIVKLPPNRKELRDLGVLDILYGAEIFVYTVLMPHYKRLSKFNLSGLYPECYHVDSTQYNEVIVLKDMRSEGFCRYQGGRFLDPDHVVVSLKSLAQFHALSMVLQNDRNNLESTKIMRPYCSNYPPQLMIALRNSLMNHLDLFKDTKYEAFFSMLADNFNAIVDNCALKTKRMIYGHGDFWKENILYKYANNKPIKACILDYQTTRLLCPAQDVLSFLLTSTETKFRREFYDSFLSTYYDCLHQTLLDHSLDSNCVYSRNDFNQDLKTVALYCFITTNMSFSLWLGLEEEALIQSKNICEDGNQKIAAINYYKQLILDIVEDFINIGYYIP